MHRRTLRVVRNGHAVTFYDENNQTVDLLVVLSMMLAGQLDLHIDDFAVRLESATLKRISQAKM